MGLRVSAPLPCEKMRGFAWLVAGVAWMLSSSCGPPQSADLRVFASASLAPAFGEIATEFERAHGHVVRLHSAGTARLLVQWRETGAADVFAAADSESLDRVLAGYEGSLPAAHEFAVNQLALVFDAENPHQIESVADLAIAGLRVALAGPEVPAGRYARRALAKARVEVRSVSDEPSVRALLQKLALGELDAALVYASDLRHLPDGVRGQVLPAGLQPDIRYPIAALPDAEGALHPAARPFVDFVKSPKGQQILRDHGFGAAR